jgi:hypothetical protein
MVVKLIKRLSGRWQRPDKGWSSHTGLKKKLVVIAGDKETTASIHF